MLFNKCIVSFFNNLVAEVSKADLAKASENEIRARLFELEKDLKGEKERLFAITYKKY